MGLRSRNRGPSMELCFVRKGPGPDSTALALAGAIERLHRCQGRLAVQGSGRADS